eukprot:TRINITY_DN34743_c0_g1_i1.p1 TRINITY_DN34743_c0_g1~~TRINITY_DN34743_c0_g1_i1.p1  ORF type:complete len:1694 (-),score=385.43 TRINITY_DN34743_c0_g1_i1:219-5300(-)
MGDAPGVCWRRRLFFLTWILIPAASTSISSEVQLNMLAKSRSQVVLSQKMTTEFLLVAQQVSVNNNRALMQLSIDKFALTLSDMISGNAAANIAAPPNPTVTAALASLNNIWSVFRELLLNNKDNITDTSFDVMDLVAQQSQSMLAKAEEVVDAYDGFAMSNNVARPQQAAVIAERQLVYLEQMCKEVLFVTINENRTDWLENLKRTVEAFDESHLGLLRGVKFLGLSRLSKKCTLHKMVSVSEYWNKLNGVAKPILDGELPTSEDVKNIAAYRNSLSDQMTAAIALFNNDDGSCDAASGINEAGWRNILKEVFSLHALVEKAARLFFQVAKGISVEASRVGMVTSLSRVAQALQICIEGSASANIPSPPTQPIVEKLLEALDMFNTLQSMAMEILYEESILASQVRRMAKLTTALSEAVSATDALYMAAVYASNKDVTSSVLEASYLQNARLETMVKEAVLVSLDERAKEHKAMLEKTSAAFVANHQALLEGRTTGHVLPRTTNACTLALMRDLLERFHAIDLLLDTVVGGGLKEAQVVQTFVNVDEMQIVASTDMNAAVTFYETGVATCNTELTTSTWEESITQVVKAGRYFQNAQKNFVLAASGLAAIWAAQAAEALKDHEGYILSDGKSPTLLEAIQAFKISWNEYAGSDDERMAGLQKQYILDNPHQTGSKDMLDYAPGPEQYHIDHRKYHPIYRKRLYDRNYYDIFFFDLEGNLIYTVFKELDYATNFDADRGGQWKDSGLGEAYRAALQYPDQVNIIDWKPYGPSFGALASFLAIGVKNAAGVLTGVLCTQMPPESKPIDAPALLGNTISSFDDWLFNLKFGDPASDIPPAPTQALANQLFLVSDAWDPIKVHLQASTKDEATFAPALKEILASDAGFMSKTKALTGLYVAASFSHSKLVQGTKIALASEQLMLVEKLVKQAVLMSMGSEEVTAADVNEVIATFEDNHNVLLLGNNGTRRRLQTELAAVTDVPPSTERTIVRIMGDVATGFEALKTKVLAVAAGGDSQEASMRAIVDSADGVITPIEDAYTFYSTITRSTTTISIDILAPMPLTGYWAGGATMRVATYLAEGLINEGQNILPGYSIRSTILDDKCDPQASVQIVLEQVATNDNYIALGGSGCSDVCLGTSFVASSMRLPYLSYECPSPSLSDTARYPGFTRFGTLTANAIEAMHAMGALYSWNHITIVSGDPSKYRSDAESLQDRLSKGFVTDYVFAYETEWDQIVSMVNNLRLAKRRVIYVMGSENFFRRVLCASIVVQSNLGITWLSEGSWRHEWYKKGDVIIDSHISWIKEDASTTILKNAMVEFKQAWDLYAPTHAERLAGLQQEYIFDSPYPLGSKDMLDYAAGDATYHTIHKKYHPIYRTQLYARNYYDIFIFDLAGNLIYSVYKELDYATNILTGQWKDSGLGDAFREAKKNPDVVSMIPWRPYGPSAGALASFLSIGIKNSAGELIGIFSTQMPPEAKSIDTVEPECSLENIAQAYEGGINFVGLGKPLESDMQKPLPCFPGHSAQSFLELTDKHLLEGYPLGQESTKVKDPYYDIKAHAADGVCAFAYTVKYLLDEGHSISDIRRPTEDLYRKFLDYLKTILDFQGVSGRVMFEGNDRPAYLAIQQVREGSYTVVGTVSSNKSLNFELNAGPTNDSWSPAYPDPPPPPSDFPYMALQALIPVLCICCPSVAGWLWRQ